MPKDNFENTENNYEKTQNLNSINQKVKSYKQNKLCNNNEYENLYNNNEVEKKLGNKNNYLNSIKSENISGINNNFDNKNNNYNKNNTFEDTKFIKNKNITESNDKLEIYKNKKNGQYKLFIAISFFIGIIVFISVLSYSFLITKSSIQNNTTELLNTSNTTTVLVNDIKNNSNVMVYDIKYNKTYNININNKIELNTNSKEISQGDILNIEFENKTIKKIIYPEDFFILGDNENNLLSNFNISELGNEIYSNNEKYKLYENTIVVYDKNKNKSIKKTDIKNIDKFYMKGYKDTIYYINIIQFHGNINLKNINKIKNLKIKIDDNIITIPKDNLIPISEGNHNITITGDNINDYKTEIFIVAGENLDIDLADIQNKKSVLIIKPNVDDYKLYINDNEVLDIHSPHILNEGEYKIKIIKEGYEIWEQNIIINENSKEIDVELQKIPEPKIKFVITTYPPNAEIYIDNHLIGKSPMKFELEKGNYNFIAKIPGYNDIIKTITIDENTKSIDYSFQ